MAFCQEAVQECHVIVRFSAKILRVFIVSAKWSLSYGL